MLAWDTEHWGFPVARLDGGHLSPDSLPDILEWCAWNQVRCLYFAAEPASPETLQGVFVGGFRFVDVRVDLELRLIEATIPTNGTRLRPASGSDMVALKQLARTAHMDSRFFKDPEFDRERAEQLYMRWLDRDHEEHVVLCVTAPNIPKEPWGYVTCQLESAGVGRIGLIAVADAHRGKGLGRALVEGAIAWFKERNVSVLHVATQAANVPAMRLYEAAGFRTEQVKVWFHRWF